MGLVFQPSHGRNLVKVARIASARICAYVAIIVRQANQELSFGNMLPTRADETAS
jgi:hypothetical protein